MAVAAGRFGTLHDDTGRMEPITERQQDNMLRNMTAAVLGELTAPPD